MGCMMQEEYSGHLIGGHRLFAFGSKHKAFLLRGTTVQRSSGCKLINGRMADLRHHAIPDQVRSSRLRGRCSLASIVIALGIVLRTCAVMPDPIGLGAIGSEGGAPWPPSSLPLGSSCPSWLLSDTSASTEWAG
jgi:hypothetical protein